MSNIKHFFVLMLENRSFDHLFAYSGIGGVTPPPSKFKFKPSAVDQLSRDPLHEFEDVAKQINGGRMDGFLKFGGRDSMRGFDRGTLGVLNEIAKDGILMDRWYSSVPGPTWPNRLFAHAGSSGGLDNSMGFIDVVNSISRPSRSLQFTNGHIFDRLVASDQNWRVYHGDSFPQVLSLKEMVEKRGNPRFFRPLNNLARDLSAGIAASYTFIEPYYGILLNYRLGNSQHPLGRVSKGEDLASYVYSAIFESPVGANSALLIVWDEHGGFFDRMEPPVATPPNDEPLNAARARNPQNFQFNKFGVRVPAILVSPWLPTGLGTDIYGECAFFDHASIVQGLRDIFSLGSSLTERDGASPSWHEAICKSPRALHARLSKVRLDSADAPPTPNQIRASGPPGGNVLGTMQIAVDIDWHVAERLRVRPLLVSEFADRMIQVGEVLRQSGTDDPAREQVETESHKIILEYIAAVEQREARIEAQP